MPQEGYESVTVPEDDLDRATDYKPDGVTWGDCLVAGAERLNEHLDSDTAGYFTHVDLDMDAFVDELIDEIGATVGGTQVDDSELAKEVARQIDYAHIADTVSEQVARELGR